MKTNKMIGIDSQFGKELGFTSDKFAGVSYLWLEGNCIYISLIISINPGMGNFGKLLRKIQSKGYIVKVPTPVGIMPNILHHWKAEKTIESDFEGENCEVWIIPKL